MLTLMKGDEVVEAAEEVAKPVLLRERDGQNEFHS